MDKVEEEKIREYMLDFLKLDYEQGMLIVKQCHDQKLAYQKFYIAIFSAIMIVAAYINRLFPPIDQPEATALTIENSFQDIDVLIGTAFIFAGIIGYVVVKNLAHIRINAVMYSNAIVDVRRRFIDVFEFTDYPDLVYSKPANRGSGDYITILTCSFMNCVLLTFGFIELHPSPDNRDIVFTALWVLSAYSIFHYLGVERTLKRGVPGNDKRT